MRFGYGILGTRFNVCLDGETGDFSAALLRGSIKVSNKISPDEVYILVLTRWYVWSTIISSWSI